MFIDILFGYVWGKLACKLGNHKWSMERGYNGEPHHTAVCVRCKAVPKEYN